MNIQTALKLGRVSNLPTVVTNALAGMVLAGGGAPLVVPAAMLAYTAGMFLNDAFDADHDARHQPFRPIPSGETSRSGVFAWGFGMLAASVVCFALAGWAAGLAGLALAGMIVLYDRFHKENPFGPVMMGACRLLVYVAAGLAAGGALGGMFWTGAVLLMAHVMGLTFIAKAEHGPAGARYLPHAALAAGPLVGLAASVPFALALGVANAAALRMAARPRPNYGRIIPLLIAAIPLLDAMMIASTGRVWLALLAAAAFPLTLWLQRWVRGT